MRGACCNALARALSTRVGEANPTLKPKKASVNPLTSKGSRAKALLVPTTNGSNFMLQLASSGDFMVNSGKGTPCSFGRPGEAGERCRMQGFRPRDWPSRPASPPRFAVSGDFPPAQLGWFTSMPSERDLFAEEQTMATMSFGEHIEELRVRLILALAGLFVGVIIAFIPYLDLGKRVMESMEAPAANALERFYRNEYDKKAKLAEDAKAISPTL